MFFQPSVGIIVFNQGEERGISTVTGTAGPDWVFVVPCLLGRMWVFITRHIGKLWTCERMWGGFSWVQLQK